MRSITMTAEQTAVYDGSNEQAARALMSELRREAETMRKPGETVEIYTADGIVAAVVEG